MFNIIKFIESHFGIFFLALCFITYVIDAVFIMVSYL